MNRQVAAVEMQQLESRRFLSATPPPAGIFDDPTILADRQALQDATNTLITDNRAGRMTIHGDRAAIGDELKQFADDNGPDTVHDALGPLKDQLRADVKAKNKDLRAALADLRVAKRDARKLLAADLAALRDAHEAGDQDAIDAARKQLDDDKAKVQADLKPFRDAIIAIKDKWRPIITADHDAIKAKLEELDPALKPLFDKLDSDTDAAKAKVDADQNAVADAFQKLQDDIKAFRDSHNTALT